MRYLEGAFYICIGLLAIGWQVLVEIKESNKMKKVFWILFVLAVIFIAPAVLAQVENPPITIGEVSAVRVIAFLAAGMSLLFDYFPGVAAAYDKLSESNKKLLAVGLAVLVVVVAFVLTCYQLAASSLVCTPTGAWDAVSGVIYVIIVQYGFHKATKPSMSLKRSLGITS